MEQARIVLVGIGGYGMTYVSPILDGEVPRARVVGLVDPFPAGCKRLNEFEAQGVPLFDGLEAFFAAGIEADLAVIATPIQFHTAQIVTALERGLHVLCEKPLCGDAKDIPVIEEAAKKAGKAVHIGFQWSHSEAILGLKQAIGEGKFGKCVEMKAMVLWPRNADYYSRGIGWAGKKATKDGKLIYDSVINNATAHYLHNLFFLLGEDGKAAMPETIKAQLYRTNPIENFDTAKVDMTFANGAKAHMLAAHAVEVNMNPIFDLRFEGARVCYANSADLSTTLMPAFYEGRAGSIVAQLDSGELIDFGNPFADNNRKLNNAIDSALNGSTYTPCGVEATAVHTRVINYIQENFEIVEFKAEEKALLDKLTYVPGLVDRMVAAYKEPAMRI